MVGQFQSPNMILLTDICLSILPAINIWNEKAADWIWQKMKLIFWYMCCCCCWGSLQIALDLWGKYLRSNDKGLWSIAGQMEIEVCYASCAWCVVVVCVIKIWMNEVEGMRPKCANHVVRLHVVSYRNHCSNRIHLLSSCVRSWNCCFWKFASWIDTDFVG